MEDKKVTVKAGDTEIKMDQSPICEELRRRIWACNSPMNVVQLRNCVTDMFMLKFLSLGEYADLNGEIDRYVNYSIRYGIK